MKPWLSSIILIGTVACGDGSELRQVGVAKIDVTPQYPIRLTGYAVRKTESEGVEQRLWAKALAIGGDAEGPAILLTVDNCGVCANLIDEVTARLKSKTGIPRERIAVCSSHTHSGPCTLARKDRKSTRLNSSHGYISYAVFCLKKKKQKNDGRAAAAGVLI